MDREFDRGAQLFFFVVLFFPLFFLVSSLPSAFASLACYSGNHSACLSGYLSNVEPRALQAQVQPTKPPVTTLEGNKPYLPREKEKPPENSQVPTTSPHNLGRLQGFAAGATHRRYLTQVITQSAT